MSNSGLQPEAPTSASRNGKRCGPFVLVLAMPVAPCVTLDEFPSLSGPPSTYLQSERVFGRVSLSSRLT